MIIGKIMTNNNCCLLKRLSNYCQEWNRSMVCVVNIIENIYQIISPSLLCITNRQNPKKLGLVCKKEEGRLGNATHADLIIAWIFARSRMRKSLKNPLQMNRGNPNEKKSCNDKCRNLTMIKGDLLRVRHY